MLRFKAVSAALATMLVIGGCGTEEASVVAASQHGDFPMTVDSCGREVVFDEQPERVLTVASVAAPLVAAAGAADKIVLRTFETASFPGEYAPLLRDVELVDPQDLELSLEEVVALDPDVVITYPGAAELAPELDAVGIKLLVNRGYCAEARGDFEDIFADVELFGRLLGTAEAAEQEVKKLRARVKAVEAAAAESPAGRRAVALIFDREGGVLKAYGSTSTVDKQMDILGLSNIFGDVDKRNFEPSVEEIIEREPEVVIVLTQADQTPEQVRQWLQSRGDLGSVEPVSNDNVLVLPFGYTGPSPVAVEGLEVLAEQLG